MAFFLFQGNKKGKERTSVCGCSGKVGYKHDGQIDKGEPHGTWDETACLIIEIGEHGHEYDVIEKGSKENQRVQRRNEQKGHRDSCHDPGKENDLQFVPVDTESVSCTFDGDGNGNRLHETVSDQHSDSGISIHVKNVRRWNDNPAMELFKGKHSPDQNQNVGKYRIEKRIVQIVFGPVVMNSEEIPVIYDQDGSQYIETCHQRDVVLPDKEVQNSCTDGNCKKQKEGYHHSSERKG